MIAIKFDIIRKFGHWSMYHNENILYFPKMKSGFYTSLSHKSNEFGLFVIATHEEFIESIEEYIDEVNKEIIPETDLDDEFEKDKYVKNIVGAIPFFNTVSTKFKNYQKGKLNITEENFEHLLKEYLDFKTVEKTFNILREEKEVKIKNIMNEFTSEVLEKD